MKKLSYLFYIIFILSITGCATTYSLSIVDVAENDVKAEEKRVEIDFAMPDTIISNEDIVAYASLKNISTSGLWSLEPSDISSYYYDEKNEIISREVFSREGYADRVKSSLLGIKILAVLAMVGNSLNAANAGTTTSTTSYMGHVGRYHYAGSYQTTTYNPYIQHFANQQANAENQQLANNIQQMESNAIYNATNDYLNSMFIGAGDSCAGKIVIEKIGRVKTPLDFYVNICSGNQTKRFRYRIDKPAKINGI